MSELVNLVVCAITSVSNRAMVAFIAIAIAITCVSVVIWVV